MKTIVDIYRSKRKEGAYLYLHKRMALSDLPELLLKQFGAPEFSMTLALDAEKKLARVDIHHVLNALDDQGFFLQIPPKSDEYMNLIPNDKMSR